MSTSTDAILFYGYCWDDELELVEDDWAEAIVKKRGTNDPWDRCVEPDKSLRYEEQQKIFKKWSDDNRQEIDDFHAKKKAVETEFGCDIGSHGSDNWLVPYVHISVAEKKAHRGFPRAVKAGDLDIDPKWNGMLQKFCEELGITPPDGQEPQWWLVSYWG